MGRACRPLHDIVLIDDGGRASLTPTWSPQTRKRDWSDGLGGFLFLPQDSAWIDLRLASCGEVRAQRRHAQDRLSMKLALFTDHFTPFELVS